MSASATIPRSALTRALKAAMLVVPSKSTRPILECVRLVAQDESLWVFASDMSRDIAIGERVTGASIDVAAKAKHLREIVDVLTDEDVTLDLDGCELSLSTDTTEHKLVVDRGSEMPDAIRVAGDHLLHLEAAAFASCVGRVVHATAVEPGAGRYALLSVLLEHDGERLRACATDGKRLVLADRPCEHDVSATVHVLVPRPTADAIAKLCAGDGIVDLRISERAFTLRVDGVTYSALQGDGRFPPYDQVIPEKGRPKSQRHEITVDDLMRALRQAEVSCERGKDLVPAVDLETGPKGITFTSRAAGRGEASALALFGFGTVPKLKVRLSPIYLRQALEHAGPSAVLDIPSDFGPIRIEGTDGYLAIVMPMEV